MGGLAAYALKRGGSLHPLLLPKSVLGNETGIMNPSIFLDEGKILLNIRHVNYILYHSEGKRFPHQWGPLVYLHPENDVALKTHNVMCELDENLNILSASRVDMKLDTKPTWNFVGLEDARLFKWDNKLYLCGVRRDCYDDKGKGRMELCHIEQNKDGGWDEISRHPIPAPGDDSSYCEKNWMPILDMPYHFVKWCNPTQVVKYDIDEGTTEIVYEDTNDRKPFPKDFRGGSQVLKINENQRMAFVHETNLLRDPFGRKDGDYAHRVLIWDKDWNLVHASKKFHFIGTFFDHVTNTDYNIEFVTGATVLNNDLLISFGFQDNASFVLRIPLNVFTDFLTKG